ncbi:MAG: thiamine pyrophosphate-dependent enzyme [Candidatus Dojkabacteria bacterium]|nr:MAG: thiamine pyrophosphate-dependent enzyme [Candidatus Dojkabacteria bacterium]
MGHVCSVTHKDYNSDNIYTWCTNCGNYGIHGALKNALVEECIKPTDIVLCFDIGCNGNGSDKIGGYRAHTLHGRVIPFAMGAAIANPNVHVVASAGDGATLGEGINHLIHAIRSDVNITFILHNNCNYGLTTGQASPTTPMGVEMNSTPGVVEIPPINVAQLALSLNPSFYARSFSGNVKQLTQLIRLGIHHNGFSLVEVLQDCPTYNEATPHNWYLERIYDITSVNDYSINNLEMAREATADLSGHIATGLLYKNGLDQGFRKSVATLDHAPIEIKDLLDEFK